MGDTPRSQAAKWVAASSYDLVRDLGLSRLGEDHECGLLGGRAGWRYRLRDRFRLDRPDTGRAQFRRNRPTRWLVSYE